MIPGGIYNDKIQRFQIEETQYRKGKKRFLPLLIQTDRIEYIFEVALTPWDGFLSELIGSWNDYASEKKREFVLNLIVGESADMAELDEKISALKPCGYSVNISKINQWIGSGPILLRGSCKKTDAS